jgi:hypothetical protein
MAEMSQLPLPSQPDRPVPAEADTGTGRWLVPGLAAFAAVVLGSALIGLLAGLVWSQVAPRALYVVVSGGAEAVNPEGSALIGADGWFCVIGVVGGLVTGLLGYVLAVRRYGPLPMVGIFIGGLVAAYLALWIGQRSGMTEFITRLGDSKSGTLLRAPIKLGARGAVAFWPLAAGLAAGALEGLALLRERRAAGATAGGYRGTHARGTALAGGQDAEPGE